MVKNLQLRILSYVVITYMLLAFGWWSILLFKKNEDAFLAKSELLKIIKIAEGQINNNDNFETHPEFLDLEKKYKRQQQMIFGEALVFVISLVLGVMFINRGYNNEILAQQQRRNFLLSITHELKSPISSIRLVLQTLMTRNLSKEQAEKLSTNAINDTERLNTLVNDLLLAAKVETSYQPLFEELYLNDLIKEIISKLRSKYPQSIFDLNIEGNIPLFNGDQMGMTSVALNLLENAVKYSPTPANIKVHLYEKENKVYIEIGDQGIGIADNEKKKIFNKFYRVGHEDTRKTKGTGLGLYIVNEIVKAHHGQILIKDNQPRGSLFIIKLPV